MDGQPAVYLGRIVSKQNFRAFIYAPAGHKKVVNTWDEFQKHMASGVWFESEQAAKDAVVAEIESEVIEELQEAPKKRQRKPAKQAEVKAQEPVEEVQEESFLPESEDNLAFEVTPQRDDFLSEAK